MSRVVRSPSVSNYTRPRNPRALPRWIMIQVYAKKALEQGIYYWRRIVLPISLIVLMILWVQRDRILNQLGDGLAASFSFAACLGGFKLENIELEGYQNTTCQEIMDKAQIVKGQSLFSRDVQSIKARVLELPWVRSALVIRQLPGTIKIRVVERDPIALWQKQGKLYLVDSQGTEIMAAARKDYPYLPLLTGQGAPQAAGTLLAALSQAPVTQSLIKAFTRVGQRRWNLILKDEIEVKLPEDNYLPALQLLEKYHNRYNLLDRRIEIVDLRIPNKVFLRLKESERVRLLRHKKNPGQAA